MQGISGANQPEDFDKLGSFNEKGALLKDAKVEQAKGAEAQGPQTNNTDNPENTTEKNIVKESIIIPILASQETAVPLQGVQNNPLLSFIGFPRFSQIKPEHAIPAIEKAIADCRAIVEKVVQSSDFTWGSVCAPLEECQDRLDQILYTISYMNSVVNTPELREAYESCSSMESKYSTWLGQHQSLYEAYKFIQKSEGFSALSQAQQTAVLNFLRDAKLSGIDLNLEQQARFVEINSRLSKLSAKYSNNTLDSTMGWTKHILDGKELSGVPERALAAAKEKAKGKGKEGYLFTLDFSSFYPVMTHCKNTKLRAEIYEAYMTRASDRGPNAGQWDNTKNIQEIISLKHESACLLGFANHSERSLATKMAETPKQVFNFLNELLDKTKPQAKAEFEELKQFAQQKLGIEKLEAWDVPYCTESLRKEKYQISNEEMRSYFPEQKVVSGLFEIVKRIFGITVKPHTGANVWHDSVSCYDVFDEKGDLRGTFYLDLYAREHKKGGAWMASCRDRRITQSGKLQTPAAYLTCDFNKPLEHQPALFSHDEVKTLFHEFGHTLHHILTQVDIPSVSGINGVAWDGVELPSQFLENWVWQEESLNLISEHYETKEPLPKEMLVKMLAAKNFQSAMTIVRQLEYGLFDFTLYSHFDPKEGAKILEILAEIREQVSVVRTPEWNRFPHSFSHIFSDGYSAGYYSYLWAEALSSDAFGRFKEEGIFNPKTGASFLHHILEKGGSKNLMELFTRFRGRELSSYALLKDRGVEVRKKLMM